MEYQAWCDASYRKGSPSILGYLIKDNNGDEVFKNSEKIVGCNTSTEAEFMALIALLERIKKLRLYQIKIYMDCKPVVDTIKNAYIKNKVKNKFKGIVNSVIQLINEIGIHIFNINWIDRTQNKEAHLLSQEIDCDEFVQGKIDYKIKPFDISRRAIKSYTKLCPNSSGKCKNMDQLIYKINRAASIGEIVENKIAQDGNEVKVVRYYDLNFYIKNNTVRTIQRTEGKLYFVPEKKKTEWNTVALA